MKGALHVQTGGTYKRHARHHQIIEVFVELKFGVCVFFLFFVSFFGAGGGVLTEHRFRNGSQRLCSIRAAYQSTQRYLL